MIIGGRESGHGRAGRRLSPRQEISRITQVCSNIWGVKKLVRWRCLYIKPSGNKENWHRWSRHPVCSFCACHSLAVAGHCLHLSVARLFVLSNLEKANFIPFWNVKRWKKLFREGGLLVLGIHYYWQGGERQAPWNQHGIDKIIMVNLMKPPVISSELWGTTECH